MRKPGDFLESGMTESVNEKADVMKVPVPNLALGMYVAAIDHQGRVNITNPGQIKDRQAIDKLVRNGIEYVWVDVERSAPECGFKESNKRGDSLVKLGMIAHKRNDNAAAKRYYQQVVSEYANSAAARIAKQQMVGL